MVDDETTDGRRIAQLLSSEVHGHERGALGRLSVVDADPDADPREVGAFAYAVALDPAVDRQTDDGAVERFATTYLNPEHVVVEFHVAAGTAAAAARREGLAVERGGDDPAQSLVAVENGAEVKAALRVLRAVVDERLEESG